MEKAIAQLTQDLLSNNISRQVFIKDATRLFGGPSTTLETISSNDRNYKRPNTRNNSSKI